LLIGFSGAGRPRRDGNNDASAAATCVVSRNIWTILEQCRCNSNANSHVTAIYTVTALQIPNSWRKSGTCLTGAGFAMLMLGYSSPSLAQIAPASPDHPWHGKQELEIESDAKQFRESRFSRP
jgi:hypothetical protein